MICFLSRLHSVWSPECDWLQVSDVPLFTECLSAVDYAHVVFEKQVWNGNADIYSKLGLSDSWTSTVPLFIFSLAFLKLIKLKMLVVLHRNHKFLHLEDFLMSEKLTDAGESFEKC